MNIFGQEVDEDPLYHCRTWSFDGVRDNNILILGKDLFS
jgi:hypothetical protein